ncbi:MAG: DUF4412 domain-containing protein [Candidatus Binataceae bacterium]
MNSIKTIATALAATTLFAMAGASAAIAGVVVHEDEVVNHGKSPITRSRTIMIEGNKQKIVTEHDEMVTDLDRGVMYLIVPARKSYAQMPFPPQGPGSKAAIEGMATMKFTRTGTHQTVDGYKCEDYRGKSHMMGTESKIVECFSKDAPGAKEFTSFQKAMAAKLKGTHAASMVADIPAGVPMASVTTTNMAGLKIPGMAPDKAKAFAKMMAKRPPVVTKSHVTKISMRKLSPDTFAVPAGYTLRQPRAPHAAAGPSGNGSMNKPASHSLPE